MRVTCGREVSFRSLTSERDASPLPPSHDPSHQPNLPNKKCGLHAHRKTRDPANGASDTANGALEIRPPRGSILPDGRSLWEAIPAAGEGGGTPPIGRAPVSSAFHVSSSAPPPASCRESCADSLWWRIRGRRLAAEVGLALASARRTRRAGAPDSPRASWRGHQTRDQEGGGVGKGRESARKRANDEENAEDDKEAGGAGEGGREGKEGGRGRERMK